MANRIYLCLAHMSENGMEQKYIQQAFDDNYVVPLGPNVNGFEADLKAFVGQDKEVWTVTRSAVFSATTSAVISASRLQ